MQRLMVKPERVERSLDIIAEKWTTITDETRLMVFAELNMWDRVYYDQDGRLACTGSNLQMVALAAAFVAVSEAGGQLSDA